VRGKRPFGYGCFTFDTFAEQLSFWQFLRFFLLSGPAFFCLSVCILIVKSTVTKITPPKCQTFLPFYALYKYFRPNGMK